MFLEAVVPMVVPVAMTLVFSLGVTMDRLRVAVPLLGSVPAPVPVPVPVPVPWEGAVREAAVRERAVRGAHPRAPDQGVSGVPSLPERRIPALTLAPCC
ncbi:hypothetical protein [Arthrobacter pullicola]|uniref:hypothetical protein n=1 Tax=Arthrobacter pullicola TaxID=2762224 RepID=UPI001CD906C8|nr:hypothetical protein [Arthrobacter pullicola]